MRPSVSAASHGSHRVSTWLLLPAAYYWLNHPRSDHMKKALMKLLTSQQMSGVPASDAF
jgi:hypothetical protein